MLLRSILIERGGPISHAQGPERPRSPAPRPPGRTLAQWLYEALRAAILEGRLGRGARLPATRDLARQYGVARGTVVAVFEQLQSEGYVASRVGSGTRVSDQIPEDLWQPARPRTVRRRPPPPSRVPAPTALRPFHPFEPALDEFPIELWTRIAARRLRRATRALLGSGDVRGYAPLREAIAAYLGGSRGVRCTVDQVVIVSGVQQALDLLARLLVRPGDPVWLEDPGYPGATAAFRNAGARLVPVPVDAHGLDVARGIERAARAKAVYLTPAHQFPLGATLSIERRLAVLDWARQTGARVVEDDYDSEYRFGGRPIPALQGLDRSDCVVFLGSFSKVLFSSLRLGYVVVPPALLEPLLALRFNTDRHAPTLDQAILCDFITEGHLGRHIRRMRELYRIRLAALREAATAHLEGLLEIPPIQAGLNTAARVVCGLSSRQAEAVAAAQGVDAMALDRYALERRDLDGLLLGFGAFDPAQIRAGVLRLAAALGAARDGGRDARRTPTTRRDPHDTRA
jgi:GntR family transcriptional regulator / MocR family aminotransferase